MKRIEPRSNRRLGVSRKWLSDWWPFLAVFGLGAALRIAGLRWQILADDEWHALRTAVSYDYRYLLTDFSAAASPPLPLLYKVFEGTIGLSEKAMRAPMLFFGLLALLVFPWILPASRLVDRRVRLIFALLLSISPLLIYFSRYARPYSISLFFSFVAVMAFYRWWAGDGDRHWATLYVLGAVGAPYFHFTALTTVVAPLLFAVLWWLWDRRAGTQSPDDGPALAQILLLGLWWGGGMSVVLGAPLLLDWNGLTHRAGTSEVTLQTLVHALPLLGGSGRWWVMGGVVLLAGIGATRLIVARSERRLSLYLAWVTAATAVPGAMSGATAIEVPIVFVRYNLWLAPLLLFLTSLGLARVLKPLAAPGLFSAGVVLVGIVLFRFGPIPETYRGVRSWSNHALYQYAYNEGPFSYASRVRPNRISPFYRLLGAAPAGSVLIAEAPWYYPWHHNQLAAYQEIHQQWVKSGYLGKLCDLPGESSPPHSENLRLRNAVDVSNPAALGQHGIDLVVVHRDTQGEFAAAHGLEPADDVSVCLEAVRDLFGPEVFRDRDLLVFDVRRFKTAEWTGADGRAGNLDGMLRRAQELAAELNRDTLFRDGFEAGSVTDWSRTVP